jgi:hypothetical protein
MDSGEAPPLSDNAAEAEVTFEEEEMSSIKLMLPLGEVEIFAWEEGMNGFASAERSADDSTAKLKSFILLLYIEQYMKWR